MIVNSVQILLAPFLLIGRAEGPWRSGGLCPLSANMSPRPCQPFMALTNPGGASLQSPSEQLGWLQCGDVRQFPGPFFDLDQCMHGCGGLGQTRRGCVCCQHIDVPVATERGVPRCGVIPRAGRQLNDTGPQCRGYYQSCQTPSAVIPHQDNVPIGQSSFRRVSGVR